MNKNLIYKIFFYFCYIMILVNSTCSNVTFLSNIIKYNRFIIPTILLIMICIQSKKYKKKSLVLILLLVTINFITYYITKENDLFMTVLLIICAKNIETKDFIKKDFVYKLLIILFVISCYKLGLAENKIMYREDGAIRSSLGFNHPNKLGLLIFSMCCDTMYLHYNKYKVKDFLLIIISLIICIKVCDSRASQVGVLSLIAIIAYTKLRKNNKEYKIAICSIQPIATIITFLATLLYTNNNIFAMTLNKIVSNRILYCSKFLNHYGINLFGHFFEFYGMRGLSNRLTVLDNAYMHILIHYGLINFLIIVLAFYIILKTSVKNKKYENIIYIIPFAVYGLMEHHIFEIQFNSILIYISEIIFLKIVKQNNEEKNIENK